MTAEPRLKVQFFTSYCHPAGTYHRFHNLAVGLRRLGHEVTVFAADFDAGSRRRTETRDGVTYSIVPDWRGARFFGGGCHPASAIERSLLSYGAADVAHLFQPFPGAAAAWRAASRLARVRCFDWDDLWHGGILEGGGPAVRTAWLRLVVGGLERRLPSATDHVTTCSQFLAQLATERGARGTTVVHNGFWLEPVPGRREARRSLGLDPDAWYAGLLGRSLRELPWCFEALEQAAARYPRLRLALCGYSPRVEAAVPPAIRPRVDSLGELPAADVPVFVASLDFGLLPLEDTAFNRSRFPIKFAEYLGGGVPVLLSEVGECARLSRGVPWVFSAGGGRNEWVAAFQGVADRLAAGSLPEVDRQAVGRLLSWERAAASLQDIYTRLLRR